MKHIVIFINLLLIVVWLNELNAAVFYVSPSGNDSNPGTLALPWRTIQKAASTIAAGDTAIIMAGVYQERVEVLNSGNATDYITFIAASGQQPTIDGSSITVPQYSGLFELSGRSYIRVSGLRIINSNEAGIMADGTSYIIIEKNSTYNTGTSGIGVWNSNHVLVDSNVVELACTGGMQECITVAVTDFFEMRNNIVFDCRKEGVVAKDGASNGRVYRNLVYNTDHVGVYIDAEDKHTFNIDVYQNVIHDIKFKDGITLATEQGGLLENIRVYNNISYNNGFHGLGISACCPSVTNHPIRTIVIANNTFYGNGTSGWGGGIGLDRNPDLDWVTIRNNICSQNNSFQIAVDSVVPRTNLKIDHNLIDAFMNGEGEVRGDNVVEADPLFVNAAQNDFHLQMNSPAINKGSSLDAPTTDFDGNIRPQGSDWDIGAFERVLAKLASPLLQSPVDGATGIALDTTLIWNVVSGATSYHVQVSTDAAFSTTFFDQDNITTTSQQVSGLSNNTKYYWRVNASDGTTTSPWSSIWSFTTIPTPPSAPTLASPSDNAMDVSLNPTLNWNASAAAASYQLQVSTSSSFITTIFDRSNITTTSQALSNLTVNTKYYWRVNATNDGGSSVWSAVWSFTTVGVAPLTPILLSPNDGVKDVSINPTLYWKHVSSTEAYSLQVGFDANFMPPLAFSKTGITDTSQIISGLSNNQKYYWRVSAANKYGSSSWSTVWNFTTIIAPPSAPTLVWPTDNAMNVALNPTLNWNASATATSYRLQVSTNSSFNQTVFDQSNITTTTQALSNLSTNTKYYWRVDATNAGGTSSWSNVWSFTTTVGDDVKDRRAAADYIVLEQNFPNPFRQSTVIGFRLQARGHVQLEVFDMLGRKVATIFSGEVDQGEHVCTMSADGLSGGLYYYRLSTPSQIITKAFIIMK